MVRCDSEGRLEVNDRPVDEKGCLYPGDAPSQVPFDVTEPDGTLFLLGDHRGAARDSRDRPGAQGGGTQPVGVVTGRVEPAGRPTDHGGGVHG